MKNFTKIMLVTLLFVGSMSAVAQTGKRLNVQEKESKRKELKALKVNYLTEKLSLTEAEAKVFWPIYEKYEEKKSTLRKEMHEFRKSHQAKQPTEYGEIEKMVDNLSKNTFI